MIIKSNYQSTAFVTYVVCLINMRLRNTEHLELSTKMDSKCTHKKDSLHVFWMLRVIYKKKPNRTGGFSKPNRNRTELEKSIPHIPSQYRTKCPVGARQTKPSKMMVWGRERDSSRTVCAIWQFCAVNFLLLLLLPSTNTTTLVYGQFQRQPGCQTILGFAAARDDKRC